MVAAPMGVYLLILNLCRNDLVRIGHRAVGRLRTLLQRVDELHAADDLAEHGILPVEETGIGRGDEELASVRIRAGVRLCDRNDRTGST